MEFGMLLKGQLTILIAVFTTLNFIDSPHTTKIYDWLKNSTYLKIGDDKGIFLFLFLVYLLTMVLIVELLKGSCTKTCDPYTKETIYYVHSCTYYNAILLFANFISIYIYKALYKKTLDLLLMSLVSSFFFNIAYLSGLISLSGYFYVIFILSNILCVLYTFCSNFASAINWYKYFLGRQSLFNYFK